MTKQEIIEVLETKVDWKEFNRSMTFSQAGDKVIIWMDGSVSEMSSGTHPHLNEYKNIIHMFHPCGMGNDSFEYQLEGFVTETDDGNYITEDGRILTLNEALNESIEDGDFTDWIENWKDEALRAWEESYAPNAGAKKGYYEIYGITWDGESEILEGTKDECLTDWSNYHELDGFAMLDNEEIGIIEAESPSA
jgi:hypothetical protein